MDDRDEQRAAALKRVKAKRDFRTHVAAYVIVNAMLVVTWAITGAGYFWPVWAIAAWGVGLALNAWTVYFEKPITEDEIRREMGPGTKPRAGLAPNDLLSRRGEQSVDRRGALDRP